MPKATIIIPAFNAADYIKDTLESIVRQTFEDYECFIIDDGSTDDTLLQISTLVDPRFHVISLPNSGGPAIPRNTGLKVAQGEYIFIFDSDDIMHREKLEKSIAALDSYPEAAWLFSNFQSVDESGSIIKANFLEEYETLWRIVNPKSKVSFILKEKLFNALVDVNFIGTSSVVLRRSALGDDEKFDETLKNSDDRLFWVRFSKKNPAIFLNETLHQFRIQKSAISMRSFDRRAPSKISALLKMLDSCETSAQRRSLNKQLHENYLAFANTLRRQRKQGALEFLKKSLEYGISYQWFRGVFAYFLSSIKP